jgi:hypothetical protein
MKKRKLKRALLCCIICILHLRPLRSRTFYSDGPLFEVAHNLLIGEDKREEVVIPALATLNNHVATPVQLYGGKVSIALCIGKLPKHTLKEIARYVPALDAVFQFDSSSQYHRADKCFREFILSGDVEYEFVIRARPDMFWLQDISLPFDKQAILTRARRISRGNVTMQHLSTHIYRCDCSDPDCVMVDDMFAVVPVPWQRAYFLLAESPSWNGTKILQYDGAAHVREHGGRLFQLSMDEPVRCPCAMEFNEGELTRRLSMHGAIVLISAFNFVLAPPQTGSSWRRNGVQIHLPDDWHDCAQHLP